MDAPAQCDVRTNSQIQNGLGGEKEDNIFINDYSSLITDCLWVKHRLLCLFYILYETVTAPLYEHLFLTVVDLHDIIFEFRQSDVQELNAERALSQLQTLLERWVTLSCISISSSYQL